MKVGVTLVVCMVSAALFQGCGRKSRTAPHDGANSGLTPVRVEKAQGDVARQLRKYLAAVARQDSSETKLYLSENYRRDFLKDYKTLVASGWSYSEEKSRILWQAVSKDNAHAAVTGAIAYEGGNGIMLYNNDFFFVREGDAWKCLAVRQAVKSLRGDGRIKPADYTQGAARPDHSAALLEAVNDGFYALARLHLAMGADANAKECADKREYRSATALTAAVEKGSERMVGLLLENGADINRPGIQGLTPLMVAIREGREPFVRLLVDRGADVNAAMKGYGTEDGNSAVPMARDGQRLANEGRTALMLAAAKGRESVVRLLLDKGADVNAKSADGRTALMSAVENGSEQMVRWLIEKGADVRAKDEGDRTMLANAMFKMGFESGEGKYRRIAILLIEGGADPNGLAIGTLNGGPMTVLQNATFSKWDDIARLLVEKGAVDSDKARRE